MSLTRMVSFMLFLCSAYAQFAPAPDVYIVTQGSQMAPGATMKIYRDGWRAVIDHTVAGGSHTRTLYDLKANTSQSWDVTQPAGCSMGRFSGDWGDPFASSKDMQQQLTQTHAQQVGAENMHGIPVKVWEAAIAGAGKAKVWVDLKYGLVMKAELTGPDGKTNTLVDIKEMSFAKPPASIFALPAACAGAVPPPTESEQIAALTGGNAGDFVKAMPPASPNACTVLFRVVQAGSMAPITSGFQVAIDRTIDVNHMPSYTMGMGTNGHVTFGGGGLHEETANLRNGVLRIENAPAQFYLDTAFGNAGESSNLIYRQCFGPQTVLLYVVKNPAKISDGAEWLWVKSGKFAAAPR